MNARQFTVEVAEQFLDDCDSVNLSTYDSINEAAAKVLARHPGTLDLSGLTSLSVAASKALAGHACKDWCKIFDYDDSEIFCKRNQLDLGAWLYLNGLTSVSHEAIEEVVKHKGNLGLDGLKTVSDAEAKTLAKHSGDILSLQGLTSLSDGAAAELAKHEGFLRLGDSYLSRFAAIEELSETDATLLAKHEGNLDLSGLAKLSVNVATILARHGKSWETKYRFAGEDVGGDALGGLEYDEPVLDLSGLVCLCDGAAEALIKHDGILKLGCLKRLSVMAAACLASHVGTIKADIRVLATSLPRDVYQILVAHPSLRESPWPNPLKEWLTPRFEENGFSLRYYCDVFYYANRGDFDPPSHDLAEFVNAFFGSFSYAGNREIHVLEDPDGNGDQYAFFGTCQQIKKRFPPFPITQEMADEYVDDPDRVWIGFTEVNKDAAEVLAGGEGPLHLPDVTEMTATVARLLAKRHGPLYLDGLEYLSSDVAESLATHQGELSLLGLKKVSDGTIKTMVSRQGALSITGLGVSELSSSMANILSRGIGPLRLPNVTNLPPDIAAILAKRKGNLQLDALESLAIEAVESLVEMEGHLYLGPSYCATLTTLNDTEARLLAKHNGELRLNSVRELSDTAAGALGHHNGDLFLNNVASLSVTAAESLATHNGDLVLHGIKELSEPVAKSLAKLKYSLYFGGIENLSDATAKALARHNGGLYLYSLQKLSDAAAVAFSQHEGELDLQSVRDLPTPVVALLAQHKGNVNCSCLHTPDEVEDDEPPPPAVAEAPDPVGTIVNSIGMKLVRIGAGNFLMGSENDPDEEFQHPVKITRSFYMGMYAVTQREYLAVMDSNPSHFQDDRLPVEHLAWPDAAEFCRRLSELPAEREAGRLYRLPTEAEWECACRAATTTRFNTGDELPQEAARFSTIWRSNPKQPAPVGTYSPNAWGLYEMHGNVWEWCQDWYGLDYYSKSPTADPLGPSAGTHHVLRGGSASVQAHECGSAFRGEAPTSDGPNTAGGGRFEHLGDFGLRVVCEVQPEI